MPCHACPSGHAPHDISPRVERGRRLEATGSDAFQMDVRLFSARLHICIRDLQCAATSSAAKRSSSRLASSCMDLRHSGTQQLRKAGSDRYRVVWDAMGVWDAMARCSTHGIGYLRGTQRVLNGHNWCTGAMECGIKYSGPGLAGWLLYPATLHVVGCNVASSACEMPHAYGVWDRTLRPRPNSCTSFGQWPKR